VNHRKLLPVENYFPGVKLPPHLNPVVQEVEGDYIPPERQAVPDEQKQAGGDSEMEDKQQEEGEKVIRG